MGVASAFRVGGVTKPNQSRSLGGGGIQAHTVPCREWMSTSIRKCILRSHTLIVRRTLPTLGQVPALPCLHPALPAFGKVLEQLLCASTTANSCTPWAQGWRGDHAQGCCRRGSWDVRAGLSAHLEMCSAVISARLRIRLAAKLRRRCSCPTFFCAPGSLPAAAAPPGMTLKPACGVSSICLMILCIYFLAAGHTLMTRIALQQGGYPYMPHQSVYILRHLRRVQRRQRCNSRTINHMG